MRRALGTLALPAGVYLAVTVAAPGVNGGFGQTSFWTHSAWVLGVVALCLAGAALLLGALHRAQR